MEATYGLSTRIREDPHFRGHGGESPYQLATRVSSGLVRLAGNHAGKRILIVSHGAALAAGLAMLLSTQPPSGPQYRLDNATVSELTLTQEPRLVALNGQRIE